MLDLKSMSTEELKTLQSQIAAELAARQDKKELVLYTHQCKNSANYHKSKYKHWAKLVTGVDTSKTNGYAFSGEFLNINAEHKVPVGSIVVEVCNTTIEAYLMDGEDNPLIGTANTTSMSKLIEEIAKRF
jgi:hypothetical protein